VIASSNTGYSSLGSYVILLLNVGRLNDAISVARRGLLLDPLDGSLTAAFGRSLALAGRYDEAIEILTQTVQRISGFIYPAVSLVTAAAQAGRFDIVDRLLPTEAAAQSLLGRFIRPAQTTVAGLRRPSRDVALQVVATAKRSVDRYGWVNYEALALAAHLGAVDEVFEVAEQLHVGTERARSREQGPDIYLTHGAFTHAYPQIRRDPRFVRLCHKAGLVEYWLATQRWPDCVSEVASFYDFKAECSKVASAG
jgi:tetratricopeptide (TPR) repeat protein